MAGLSDEPEVVFHFSVEFGDGGQAQFSEVSGIEAETEVIEYRSGRNPEYSTVKIPGMTKFGNVTLKRGISVNNDLFEWYQKTVSRQVERRDIIIKLLDPNHEAAVIYKIRNAWPCKYVGPLLSAQSSEIAIEELVLAHEGLSVETP